MGSPAARGAALYRAKRSMGSALQRRRCRVVSRREMGEGPFGDSDASVEACRDRDLSEWGGMGLLEAKIFGTAHFRCTQGSCGTRRGAVGRLRLRYARGLPRPILAAPNLTAAKKQSIQAEIMRCHALALLATARAFQGPRIAVPRVRSSVDSAAKA